VDSVADKERVQVIYLTALEESILRGGGNKEGVVKMLDTAKGKLEATHSELIMLALLGVMEAAAKQWGFCFKQIFTEVVDIAVGWFMESISMPDIRVRIGKALIDWSVFWQGEVEFGVDQVGYYMEDLMLEVRVGAEDDEVEIEDLEDDVDGSKAVSEFVYKWGSDDCEREEQDKAHRQVVAFLQMVDCVLAGISGVVTSTPGQTLPVPKVGLWLEMVTVVGKAALKWRWREDLAISIIRCLLTSLKVAEKVKLERYLEKEEMVVDMVLEVAERGTRMTWVGQRAMFFTIQALLNMSIQTGQLQRLVQTVVGERGLLPQVFLQTTDRAVQGAGVYLVKEILQSKNVVVLQEVYTFLCMRLEQSMSVLSSSKPFLPSNLWSGVKLSKPLAVTTALWVHASISKIATVSGSILSMWALDPSIFHLLAHHSGLTCPKVASSSPSVHHSTTTLFLNHCATHSFFLSSSSLLSPGSTSPTAGHFSFILQTLSHLQSWVPVSLYTKEAVVKTIGQILSAIKPSAATLSITSEFQSLVDSCISVCYNSTLLCLDVLENLQLVLDDFPLSVSTLVSITFLLLHLAQAGDKTIARVARRLLAKIPPQVTFSRERAKQMISIRQPGEHTKIERSLLDIFKMETTIDTLRSTDFRDFMHFIAGEYKECTRMVGWRSNVLEMTPDTPQPVSTSERLQTVWLAWTAAHLCVQTKLRTPLGKAQETLGHIDMACKKIASIPVDRLDMSQAHSMLAFTMSLEKAMVNGWDGSIAALPVANKSTQLFFHANRITCLDWLARVRPNIMRVAFNAGMYSEVVRQAWYVLPVLVKRGELEQPGHLSLVSLVCLSLAKLDAPHHLTGLYTWAKDKSGTKLKWIPCLIDLVRKQTESGVKSLRLVLEGLAGSQMNLGMEEGGQVLRPRLEELLWKGYESLSEHQAYMEWVSEYRANQKEDKELAGLQQSQDKFLISLSKFQDGIIPVTADSLEPGTLNKSGPVIQQMLDNLQLHLLQAAASLQNSYMRSSQSWSENDRLSKSLNQANGVIAKLLTSCSVTESEQRKILLFNMISQELTSIKERGPTMLSRILKNEKGGSSSELLLIIKKWGEFFLRFRKNNPECHYQISSLNLEIARVARKEKNFGLAEKFLLKSLTGRTNFNIGLEDFVKSYDFFSVGISHERVVGLRQSSKVFIRSGNHTKELAVRTVCGLALAVGQHQATQYTKQVDLLEESSRALLNLAQWLKEDPRLLESVYPEMKSNKSDLATLTQILHLETVTGGTRDSLQKPIPVSTTSSDTDLVLGRLLRLAVIQDPGLAKAWNELADWSYQMGQAVIDQAGQQDNQTELTEEEKRAVDTILHMLGDKQRRLVMGVVSQISLKDSHLAGHEYEKWDFMRRELLETGVLEGLPDTTIQQLVAIWQAVFRRVYAYYDLSAEAYFKYLNLAGTVTLPGTTSATLRLLHLTVNHALELHEVFQLGLVNTPSAQWKAIIPQLFSRLNHPVPIVKQRISDLLCRISETFPHLIIFPAVVGSLTTGAQTSQTVTSIFAGTVLEKSPDSSQGGEGDDESPGNMEMVSAHAKIVEVLKKKSPTAIEQVTILVGELRRVTLLWDELWLGTLIQYSSEVQRQIKRFQEEADRLAGNKSLSEQEKKDLLVDKYNIIFSRILYVLDQVAAITRAAPETPHEELFQRKYGKFISTLLDRVRNPADWAAPSEGWTALGQLQQQLAARAGKRNFALKLSEISPSLHSLRDTDITMPGQNMLSGLVQVARFDTTMSILPTKTKPKKLSMVGDNGQKYTYLFKGLEDLHLDERIMQFLSIANQMMSGYKSVAGVGRYSARHYSVVPLGPRSGLIQWVEGAVPLFSLYKKWQQRQQQHLENSKKMEEAAKVMGKPSDMFYSKMLPLLRKNGISKMDDRKSWPISLLKQVLTELVAETPDNLLSQELWLQATSSHQWWGLIQNITRSFAVMSVIGYIIGLGDRHLDNVLVDLANGQVVHIDYNISFEKGKNLRIPERVPCRLTQNIISVFGVAGVEGLFRQSCEHTLRVLRKGRETLLTLLEAFVYDPLVDWTPGLAGGLAGAMYGGQGAGEGQDKREMEHGLTFSMLGVRVAEMKGAWLENQHDLVAALFQVEESIGVWLELAAGLAKRGEDLTAMHRAMSMLKEAEVNPGHRLHTLLDIYQRHKAIEGGAVAAKQQVLIFTAECDKMVALHQRALSSISGPQLAKWGQEVAVLLEQANISSCNTVCTFLENAGQRELLGQYQQTEQELLTGTRRLGDEVKRALDQLNMYHALTSLYPAAGRNQHRVNMYSMWGNKLLENFSTETCDQIATEFAGLFSVQPTRVRELRTQHVKNMNMQLEQWNSEIIISMQRLYQRMMSENIMKPGKSGVLEELGKTREMILNQLNHPDSGVRPETLICFFVKSLISLGNKWSELEKNFSEENLSQNNSSSSLGRLDSLVDQLFLESGTLNTFLNTADMLNLTGKSPHVSALESLSSVLSSLQQLRSSFCTIIMPEGLKNFLHEDASVVEIGLQVEEIISSGGLALEEVKHEARLHTRCCMLGMESPHLAAVELAGSMRHRYQQLIATAGFAENMSTGQMLLCAANSLFDKVDGEMNILREKVLAAPTPTECNKFTMVKTASDLSTGAFNTTPGVWESLATTVFISKLELLRDFLSMCRGASMAFKAEKVGVMMPTGDILVRPVKKYVAEYIQLLLLGAGPRHLACALTQFARDTGEMAVNKFFETNQGKEKLELEEIFQALFDDKMSTGALNQARIAKSSVLVKNLTAVVYKWELAQQLDQGVDVMSAAQQVNALQHAGVQWYHEEYLPRDNNTKLAEPVRDPLVYKGQAVPTRHNFLSDLRSSGDRLNHIQAELASLCLRYSDLKASVDQRLKWAVGANPSLKEVVDQFSCEQQAQLDTVRQFGTLVKSVVGVGQSALQFEALRTSTVEARAGDHQFLGILACCRDSSLALGSAGVGVGISPEETMLLDVNPPLENIDQFWIRQTEELIACRVKSIQDTLAGENKKFSEVQRSIQDIGVGLKDIVTSHHKLMADVALLLRTIQRIENFDFPAISNFLSRYKEYSEQLNSMIKTVLSEDLSSEGGRMVVERLDMVKEETNFIYEELINIAAVARDESLVQEMFKSRRSLREETIPGREQQNVEMDEKNRAKRDKLAAGSRQVMEEKNKFALSVLRRVRVKLEGREPDSLRKASVGEQVDFIIREAMNQENLALMYEGWTAWI